MKKRNKERKEATENNTAAANKRDALDANLGAEFTPRSDSLKKGLSSSFSRLSILVFSSNAQRSRILGSGNNLRLVAPLGILTDEWGLHLLLQPSLRV